MRKKNFNSIKIKRMTIILATLFLLIFLSLMVKNWFKHQSDNGEPHTIETTSTEAKKRSTETLNETEIEDVEIEIGGTGKPVKTPLQIEEFMNIYEFLMIIEPGTRDSQSISIKDLKETFGEPTEFSKNVQENTINYIWESPVKGEENSVLNVRFSDGQAVTKSVIGLDSRGTTIINKDTYNGVSIENDFTFSRAKRLLKQPDGITEFIENGDLMQIVSWISRKGNEEGANVTIVFKNGVAIHKSSSGLE
ncbi:DUF3862 domain-containing protein [Aerococcaceae bacterium 50-4]